MWIMTTKGFFSAVQKPGDDFLTVRARARGDLENLADIAPSLGPIQAGGGTDYPFRARISHEDFALVMAEETRAIDYSNFKSAVGSRHDMKHAKAYGRCWSALLALETA